MDELKTEELELTTADLASHGTAQKQPNEPKRVKGQEPVTLNEAAVVPEPMPLFSESEMEDFRSQWSSLQTGFVDEPRRAGQAGSFGDAAPRGRFREGAIGLGKTVGQRR